MQNLESIKNMCFDFLKLSFLNNEYHFIKGKAIVSYHFKFQNLLFSVQFCKFIFFFKIFTD